MSAPMSVTPPPGLVTPAATALCDVTHEDDGRRPDRADDLGHDVADGVDRCGPAVEDHRDRHGRVEVPARDVAEREDRGQQAEAERERHDEQARVRTPPPNAATDA